MEQLAQPQAPSRSSGVQTRRGQEGEDTEETEHRGVSGPAQALLKFSTPRDPAQLAAFTSLRILNPNTHTGAAASRPPPSTPASTGT